MKRRKWDAKARIVLEGLQGKPKDACMARKHARLKTLVGEITLELQNSDEGLG